MRCCACAPPKAGRHDSGARAPSARTGAPLPPSLSYNTALPSRVADRPEPSCVEGCNRCDPMEGRPEDDRGLFARAQRGETAAYEEIVQRYQQIAFRTAYVITR